MAWSTVTTKIANPATSRRKVKAMPKAKRKMSAKQIKHFGTARQKAALKASRKRKVSAKRHAPARKRANPTRKRAVARKRNPVRKVTRRAAPKRRRAARKNPGEIVSLLLGNPAKRRKAVATKRRRKAVARRNPAGTKRRRTVRVSKKRGAHRRRSNPGPIGNPKTWIVGGAGVLAGVFVSRGLPQLVLGAGNTGAMGYAANAAAAAAAGYATHMLTRNPTLTAGVVAGGFAALLARLISDYTPYGKALALSGWGDYQFSNIVGTVPQRLIRPGNAVTEWGGPAPASGPRMVNTGTGGDVQLMANQC